MAEHAGKPKVRFAGFTETWEQRKVGNLIEDYVERTTIQNQYPVLTSSQQQGIVLQEAYFADRQVTTNDNVGYFVLPKGYFTYRSRSDTDVFVFNRNDILDKGIISYYYPVFQTKYTCSDFLLRRLNHGIRKQLAMAAEGTGQKVLAHSKFKNMTVSVPKIGEQQKIGTFFRQLDRLITLHQRKRGRLENIKKAMLEKMFPKNGADVPEVRFAGFTEAWEQRKLGELTNISSASRVHKGEWTESGVPFFRSSDVVSAFKGEENEKAFISYSLYEGLAKKSGKVQEGDVLITGGGSIGIPYLVKNNEPLYFKDADLLWLKQSRNLVGNFLYTFFTAPVFSAYVQSISHIGTIAHYTIEQIKDTPILFPKVDEQQKIGTFFRHLDHLITLHQRKVALLQNIKKACLEKMFV